MGSSDLEQLARVDVHLMRRYQQSWVADLELGQESV
jgi:hypothetical protein